MKEDQETQSAPVSNIVKYIAISFLISIIVCMYNVFSPKGVVFSFWEWIAIVVFMTIIPGICTTIANYLRMILHPDFIITNDGMKGLLKAKIFWAIGPQCIGWFIGFMITSSLLKAFFDISI